MTEPLLPNGHASSNFATDQAPWIPVSAQSIVSVEHPYIVRNIEKGLEMLGGRSKLDNVGLLPLG